MAAARALLPIVATCLSCASAGTGSERGGVPPIAWPAPPEKPAVRLVAVLPDEAAERRAIPWWRRALGALAGADAAAGAPPPLVRPFAVTFEGQDTLLVADPDAARVYRLGGDGARQELSCKGRPWGAPMAVAAAADGAVYVADASEAVVVRWREGRCTVLGEGALERPTGLTLAPDAVWVADPPRHQVVALSPAGAAIARVGGRGGGTGQFHFPTAVARAPDGTLLVVDSLNFRVVRLASNGSWMGAFGGPGDTAGGLARPKAVAVGADATIFVSDAQRDVVLAFSSEGSFLYELGASGAEPGHLAHPAGIDRRDDRLAVADSQNRRIQVFEILKEHR